MDKWVESHKQKTKFSNFQKCQKIAINSEQIFFLRFALFMVKPGIWKLDGCPSRRLLLYLCVLSFVFKISHLFASNESDFIIFQIAVKIDQSNISISVNKSEKNCDKKFPSDRIQDGWMKCL